MDNDYIILFDENGSPYIAHAFGDRLKSVMSNASGAISNSRGNWKNHKYIEKIKENGKTLYFYTQEELQRYYNNKKNQAKETVNKVVEPVRTEAKTIKYNLNSNINAAKKAGNTVISKVKSAVQKANDISESEVKATSKSRQEREYSKRIEAINSSLNKDMKTSYSSAFYDSHPDIKAGQIILQNKRARENKNKNGRSKFNDYQQELTLQGTDYSPTEINKKVDAALIESGIQEYTGSDPAIKKTYNLIRQQREYYERSKVDLDEAKKVLEQSQREYERLKRELEAAKRTYKRRVESGGSSKDRKKLASEIDSMTEQLKVYEEAYTKDLNLVKTLSIVEQHELSEYQKKVSNYRITSRFQSRNKKIGSGTASLSGNNKNNHISGKF